MVVSIPNDLEERLVQEAEARGVSANEFVIQLLNEHLAREERRAEAIALLQSWIDEPDDDEQREAGEELIRNLDADRLSDRPLYPPELKGKTW